MPARIEIGRFGFRGAKAIKSDEAANAVTVDCRRLVDPDVIKEGKRVVGKRRMRLDHVKAELLRDQHDLTQSLVNRVIDAVLDGKLVCVRCMMGKNRSQAVASLACEELERSHPGVVYEGPVYLGGIKKTP